MEHPPHPVLLVHGLYDTGQTFGPLAEALRARGFAPHTLDLVPNDGKAGLDDLAGQVGAFVAQRFAPEEPFSLVGFSMGGLVSRYYVQRLGGAARVRRLITLAAPHRGSLLAYLLNNPGGLQMRPGSPFLTALNDDCGALDEVGFVSLWTPFDLMILPARSSVLPVGQSETLSVPSHPGMLASPRVITRVVELLDA